jgi:multidrug efflux system membrane fusion protein
MNLFSPHSSAIRLVALFSSALFSGCGKKDAALVLPPPVVTTTAAVQQEVQNWDDYTGRLAAVGTVEIRPRVSGYITEVKFSDGDLVQKGQILFVIDPRPYQAVVDKAQGEFDTAEAAQKLAEFDLARAKQLRDRGVTSAGEYDQSAAAYQKASGTLLSAKSALESAKLDREFCSITAPIEGRASLANVTIGNLVAADAGNPLTTIITTNPIYAYADVDERSLLRYVRFYLSKQAGPQDVDEVKAPIELALQDENNFPHRGYIDFIDNRVDPATGTIRLRGVFDSEKGLLGPGLFIRVRIPAGMPYDAVLVPPRSVGSDQGEKFVVVIGKDDVASFRPVKLGTVSGGLQVISTGVSPGEMVVVDGLLKVRPGEKVTPKPAEKQGRTSDSKTDFEPAKATVDAK